MAKVAKRRGRYVLDFYDHAGKRRWHTCPKGTSKSEANEILGEIERKIRQGNFMPASKLPPFKIVADSWLASKEPNLRNSTYEQYKGHLENHLKPFFGPMRISLIAFDTIEKFKAQSLKKGVTVPTLRKILVNLGAILTYAVRSRYIDFNPAREIEKPTGRSLHSDQEEMNILMHWEIRSLIDATGSQKYRCLFMAAILTGMREGELLGLKWEDFNWITCQAHVRRTFNHGKFYEPKTKTSRRKIDLPQVLVQELKRWKLACPIGELGLVFPTEVGTPMRASSMFYRHFLPALRRAGLQRIRFHDLRHTYASLLIHQGEHPKYIQAQMGHSSIKVTMDTYGHLMDTINREAANRLGDSIFGGAKNCHGSNLVAVMEKGVAQPELTP